MRLVSVLCICMALVLSASAVLADPNNATQKPWSYPHDFRTVYAEAEPNNACPGQQVACGDDVNPASLTAGDADWYTFTATAGDQMNLKTYSIDGLSTDTYLELYSNDCATQLAYNDDGAGNLFSFIQNFIAPYTGVYNLKCRGYGTSTTGNYGLEIRCSTPPPPAENDTCAGAIDIPRCTAGSLSGDWTSYRNDYNPPTGCTGYTAGGKDGVYKADLQAGDQVTFTYTQLAYDASLYVVNDCTNMNCVAGADDGVTGDPETVQFTAASTGTYYFILDTYGTDTGGAWTADYNLYCPPPPEPQACCFNDGSCQFILAADCTAQGGHPQGNGTTCDTVNCDVVPAQNTTWGQIKSNYR